MSERRPWRRRAAALALAAFCASFLPALLPALAASEAGARCCRGGCCCAPAKPTEGVCLRSGCGCGETDAPLVVPLARLPALVVAPLRLAALVPLHAVPVLDARARSAERRVPDPPPRLAASLLG